MKDIDPDNAKVTRSDIPDTAATRTQPNMQADTQSGVSLATLQPLTETSKIEVKRPQLPQGGGAIKSIGETFKPNLFSGTGNYTIPFPITPARGFEPELALNYSSGSGNGVFGIGFDLSVPKIARRTEKGLPQYTDHDEFIGPDGELLIPKLDTQQRPTITQQDEWRIHEYLPRVEAGFAQIEYWQHAQQEHAYWRIIAKDNSTWIYGRAATAKIVNPKDTAQIFEWLLEEAVDSRGNKIIYEYKAEDNKNIDFKKYPWEQHRALSQKYLHAIRYGNYFDGQHKKFGFEIILDYGEYKLDELNKGGTNPYVAVRDWDYRPDAFSAYRSCFEIRTRRRCKNILLFHHFAQELGDPCLVKRLQLDYLGNETIHPANLSLITSATLIGYQRRGKQATDAYLSQAMPSVDFQFSHFKPPANPEYKKLHLHDSTGTIPSLQGNGFQPVDLKSEGITGLLYSDHSSVLYFNPEGEGSYSAPELLKQFPIDKGFEQGQAALVDLESNGELALVVKEANRTGYYAQQADGGWGNYQPFKQYLSTYADPHLEMADLSADGKTDLLLADIDELVVYPSLGKMGYAAADKVKIAQDFPLVKTADKQERVVFTNLLGDGLAHRVKICNGAVECWPSLGYGRFGEKIILGNAPDFGQDFDASRLFLADVDGSGTTDLIYVHSDKVELFINQSGNAFSQAITVGLPKAQQYTALDQISFADVLGNGTTCLVLSKVDTQPQHFYFSFVGEVGSGNETHYTLKPYLVDKIDNNLGVVTHFTYTSSVEFYLKDKKAGQAWQTRLPFPVQVLKKVVTEEHLSGSRFEQSFAYHEGYYDTVEREFRGFAYVESWDAEIYKNPTGTEEGLDPELYVPPVHTKSWFHTGYHLLDAHIRKAFYQGDEHAYHFPDSVLPEASQQDAVLRHQALWALKGQLLREEIYADDDSPQAQIPYSVAESNFEVRLLQKQQEKHKYAAFLVIPRESIHYHYERNPTDPRVEQQFNLAVDEFGHITQACQVFLPRRNKDSKVHPQQQKLQALLTANQFINETQTFRVLGVPYEAKAFELHGLNLPDSGYFSFAEIKKQAASALQEILSHDAAFKSGKQQARQLSWQRTYFWNIEQTHSLPLGQLTAQTLTHHTANAEFTQTFINEVYQQRLDTATVKDYGGYLFDERSQYWWNHGLTQHYLGETQFFMPSFVENTHVVETSPLHTKTELIYDSYCLYVTQVADYYAENAKQTTRIQTDYISSQPQQIIDINYNTTQVLFDPLGEVIVSTQFGEQQGQRVGGVALLDSNAYQLRTVGTDGQAISVKNIID